MNRPNDTPPDQIEVLYAKREKIYPRAVSGIFAFWRSAGVFVLLGLYYTLPWFQWNGRQAVLFDLPARKFYLFGYVFWPQDFIYLAVLLIIAALSLFFFTALAGRLFCGYACPQTVWTEVFLWIERKIEGDRNKQIKLDKQPLNAKKFAIKGSKHAVWLIFALFTGFIFVGYFTPVRDLWHNLGSWQLGPWETFWILFYSFATYGNAGWLREQVCIYMCPYARFQSAMFDSNTLIISYDENRGEPRGSRKRGADAKPDNLGDCIDCTLCVQVCPTGIDIRNGLQYQCIGCAACIDVCDSVMAKMQYPKGLISYTTEETAKGKPFTLLRPRIIIYTVILVAILSALLIKIGTRVPLDIDIIRDRQTLYRETPDGKIQNLYTVKILNMDEKDHRYRINVTGLDKIEIEAKTQLITVPAGDIVHHTMRLNVDPYQLQDTTNPIKIHVQADDAPSIKVSKPHVFLGPK